MSIVSLRPGFEGPLTLGGLIEKFGAGTYLRSLRRRLAAGLYTPERYRFLAARAYLAAGMPWRARALLEQVATDGLYEWLMKDIERACGRSAPPCSLNMIVKNEEASLGGALDSVDALVDEIVVCDTGSTDGTADVALLYGATVIRRQWKDDFAWARNQAVEASRGRLIFWMDADDRLDRNSRRRFRKVVLRGGDQAAAFCVCNERPNGTGAEFLQVRFFPRRRDVYFERKIHEQLMFSAAKAGVPVAAMADIRIIHTGYVDAATHRAKAARNLPLVLEELRSHPGDPALLLSLADCYAVLERQTEALEAYGRIVSSAAIARVHPDVHVRACIVLGGMLLSRNEIPQAREHLYRALHTDQTAIEAIFLLGLSYWKERSFNRALCFFRQSSRLNPPLRVTAADTRLIKLQSIYYLADILLQWEHYRQAESVLEPAIEQYPQVVEYYVRMGDALLGSRRLREAARHYALALAKSPSSNPGAYSGLARIYMELQDPAAARKYLEKAVDNGSASPEISVLLARLDTGWSAEEPQEQELEAVVSAAGPQRS
jgi:tetratricopeptide (TPR) repeat protein